MSVSVWRIATETPDYTADDVSGEGARRSGGRWNRPGTPMVYLSSSIALACLETLVHLNAAGLPLNRYLVRIDIPDGVWTASIRLRADDHIGWDANPVGRVSLEAGEAWCASQKSALLIVPSVIVPEETNILLNPLHAHIASVQVSKLRRWTYDARLRK